LNIDLNWDHQKKVMRWIQIPVLFFSPWHSFLPFLLRWPSGCTPFLTNSTKVLELVIALTVNPLQCERTGSIARNWNQTCFNDTHIFLKLSVLLDHITNSFPRNHGCHPHPSIRGVLIIVSQSILEQLVLFRSPSSSLAFLEQPVGILEIGGWRQYFNCPIHDLTDNRTYPAGQNNSFWNQLSLSLSLLEKFKEREIPEIGMHGIGGYIGQRNPNPKRLCSKTEENQWGAKHKPARNSSDLREEETISIGTKGEKKRLNPYKNYRVTLNNW